MQNRVYVLVALVALMLVGALVPSAQPVRAHDIPDEFVVQAFVKPEGDRMHVLLRVPLVLLLNMDLPKRGPGYLDLANVDDALDASAAAVARDVAFFEDGSRLTPDRTHRRISIPSDRSFERYETALAHVEGPPLPENTNVFWNQGFFDLHLEYPIRSAYSDFALEVRMAPEVQRRLHVVLRFLMPDGTVRAYDLAGDVGRVPLDPRWYQAAWTFTKTGFFHILDGIDHLLFLLCLVIPFTRSRLKPLIAVVTAFTVAHSITLIGAALELGPSGEWFPPLVETLIAASIVYMAVENILVANLRRRWLITGAFGLVHGFGFSYGLRESFQFAGDHLLLSLLSFNVGVELGQILVLILVIPVLRLLFRHLPDVRLGVIVLSAFVAHTGWHWMVDRAADLQYVAWPALNAAVLGTIARWTVVLLVAGGVVWWAVQWLERRTERQPPLVVKDELQ